MTADRDTDSDSRDRLGATLWALRLVWQGHRRLVVGLIACTLIRGLSPAGFALAMRGLVNAVTSGPGGGEGVFNTAILWLLFALAVTIADSLTGLVIQFLSDSLKSDLSLDVNSRVMQHAATLDMPYIEDSHNREVLQRMRQDPGDNLHLLFIHSQRAAVAIFQIGSLAAVLAWLEPAVILFAAVIALPYFLFQWRLSRRRYLTEFRRARKRRWTGYFLSRLTSPQYAGEVRLLGIGALLTRRFTDTMSRFRDEDLALNTRQLAGSTAFVTVTTLAFYALFARVVQRTLRGELSIGDLAIFGGAVVRLRSALETAITFLARGYEQTLYMVDLRAFLQSRPALEDRGNVRPASLGGALQVKHLNFSYPGTDQPVLRDISFTVQPGETVAIVGENGCGKSTLAKLLARLYDPDGGVIELDGTPLRDYSLEFLHRHVALLAQNFGRYEASVAENIAYGDWDRLESDRDTVNTLAATTGVDHIAAALPAGLDTPLGREFAEHDLSGGQWQLLAITRTLARSASVLILDEPTSNIDARAEHGLFTAISRLAKGVTTIIISHRFSTISMADRILVMDAGTVVEEGRHDVLLRAGGHYARLYALHEHYRMKEPGTE